MLLRSRNDLIRAKKASDDGTFGQVGAARDPGPLGHPATWAAAPPVERVSEWPWTDGCRTRRLGKKPPPVQGVWGLARFLPPPVRPVANTSSLAALDMAFLGHSYNRF